MTDRTWFGRSIPFGTWHRSICWLVRPTVFDVQIPDDHTIMYVLTERHSGQFGNQPPQTIARSIDRAEIEALSIEMHKIQRPHGFHTEWYDPFGKHVKKFEVIARQKELALIEEYESSGEFRLEHGPNLQQVAKSDLAELKTRLKRMIA